MKNCLEIKDLCKSYGDFALDHVNLTIPGGTIMGLIGENGAGKTTTIKCILNLIRRDSGTITILGKDNVADERAAKLEVGVVLDECFFHTQADQAFHTAIVRAAHNEFLLRLLPIIHQAVSTAVERGEHREQLAEDTLRDHALLLEFLKKRDGEGAEHAMAIHMRHSMDVMGLAEPGL